MSNVLILGSGPNVVQARDWDRSAFDTIVTINNAWAVRPDWDYLIHPEDFPVERHPVSLTPDQKIITAETYVPANNAYGGILYAGGTMAFTAGYWALHALRPKVMAFMGCDMVYPKTEQTHFYGTGEADPLRADITLRSLEAKAARLMFTAADQGCAAVNLSTDESRLVFPRATPDTLAGQTAIPFPKAAKLAFEAEQELGYVVPSGRYWQAQKDFDPAEIDRVDALWLAAAQGAVTASADR